MQQVVSGFIVYAKANGPANIGWYDGAVKEGRERVFPYGVVHLVGGTIDRCFRNAGESVTAKLEGTRLQMDLHTRWDGKPNDHRALFQTLCNAMDEATITLDADEGTRRFVSLWRDGLERETVEDKEFWISQDWLFTVQQG